MDNIHSLIINTIGYYNFKWILYKSQVSSHPLISQNHVYGTFISNIGSIFFPKEQSISFISALAGKVESNLNYKFSKSTFLNILCGFVKTELFQKIDFETIYSDIDEFIETINEIADNYFYEQYNPRGNY